jgi:septal ring factor EnvC (AmiA/AmiB activator)
MTCENCDKLLKILENDKGSLLHFQRELTKAVLKIENLQKELAWWQRENGDNCKKLNAALFENNKWQQTIETFFDCLCDFFTRKKQKQSYAQLEHENTILNLDIEERDERIAALNETIRTLQKRIQELSDNPDVPLMQKYMRLKEQWDKYHPEKPDANVLNTIKVTCERPHNGV